MTEELPGVEPMAANRASDVVAIKLPRQQMKKNISMHVCI